PLVGDEYATAVREQPPRGPEHVNRMRHVVQRLEDRYEVVAAGQLGIRGIPAVERYAVLHAASGEELLSSHDRGVIEVDPVDRDLGVGAGDRDTRPAHPPRTVAQ